MRRRRVDLPHPDGPMRETNSPGETVRLTSLSAATVPSPWPRAARFDAVPANVFVTSTISTASWLGSVMTGFVPSVAGEGEAHDGDDAPGREPQEHRSRDRRVRLGGIARA